MSIIIPEDILKVTRIGNKLDFLKEGKPSYLFTEIPLSDKDSSNIFYIKMDKWYHNFFGKQRVRIIKYYLKKRNKCSCNCHITPGFYHCWDNGCCSKENINWRKL
jgi:hypothetical protein